MDYPTLITKYLGARNPKQLANDIKNLTEFEAKGGNPEELLKTTRAKILSGSVSKINKQRENLQQSVAAKYPQEVETPAALAAKNAAAELAQFEARMGVPQMKSAYEQEAQRLAQVKAEQAAAPDLLMKELRAQPRLGASVADMVKEFSDPSSPSFMPSSAAIIQAVSGRVNAQRATLGDALRAVESVYKQMAEEQKTATESRKELLQDAQKNALGLYKDFTDLQQQLDKEARDFATWQEKEKIEAMTRSTTTGTTGTNPEIDRLARAYLKGESLGSIGAAKKAQVLLRADEIQAEMSTPHAYSNDEFQEMFNAAEQQGWTKDRIVKEIDSDTTILNKDRAKQLLDLRYPAEVTLTPKTVFEGVGEITAPFFRKLFAR